MQCVTVLNAHPIRRYVEADRWHECMGMSGEVQRLQKRNFRFQEIFRRQMKI